MWKRQSAALQAVRFAVRLKLLAGHHAAHEVTITSPLLTPCGQSPQACSIKDLPAGALHPGALPAQVVQCHRSALQSDVLAIWHLLRANWVNFILLLCPVAVAAGWCEWGSTPTFCLNFVVLIPLAMTLGDITEDLALRLGDVAGGLLNATFGNVTEVVLSIAALRKGLLDIVADTLLGSILSNLLLVLGTSFFVGGLVYPTQTFNASCNRTCGSLLFLSCIGIAIPTCASSLVTDALRDDWVLQTSRGTAIVLLTCYVCYLVFQLVTHKHLFDAEEEEEETEQAGGPHDHPGMDVEAAHITHNTHNGCHSCSLPACLHDTHQLTVGSPHSGIHAPLLAGCNFQAYSNGLGAAGKPGWQGQSEGEGSCSQVGSSTGAACPALVASPSQQPVISAPGAVAGLAVISALVAVHSEYLTRTIEDTSKQTGISTGFLALIVLPIAGNACEHLTAVIVAYKNKMDLAMSIAIGSSLQIALFAIPLAVIAGWIVGQPMSLSYDGLEVVALVLSVIHANLVNADGSSHWLMGVQLCAVYVLISLVYRFR